MATFFSDHYTTGLDQTSLPTLRSDVIPDANKKHGRARISRATLTVTTATSADDLRFLTMKSSDRLHWIGVWTDGELDATAGDVGIYLTGDDHDGAVQDVNLFVDPLTLTSPIDTWDSGECFTQNVLGGEDRGKPLWEILAVGDGSDTEDPNLLYDLAITLTANNTVVGVTVMEVCYTAGD
jgi:hypothetical protein